MKYESVRKIPNFKGRFFTWNVMYHTNREKGLKEHFVVFSSGKRNSVWRSLWLKLVWDELSKEEFLLFLSMPETLKDEKVSGFLRARLSVPKRVLRQRLIILENYFNMKESSHLSYLGYHRLKYEIQREIVKLPRVPKFSGYVRNISSIGSKSRGSGYPEPESYLSTFKEDSMIDWFEILTVGEFTLIGQSVRLPEENRKVRNGNPKIKPQ